MIEATATPAGDISPAAFRTTGRRPRSSAGGTMVSLKSALSIGESQMRAWTAFSETLAANTRRLNSVDSRREHPFGQFNARLAALKSMRQAGAVLLSVLDTAQQHKAMHILPLCCLPTKPAD